MIDNFCADNLVIERVDLNSFSVREIGTIEGEMVESDIKLNFSSYSGMNLERNAIGFGLKIDLKIKNDEVISENNIGFLEVDLLFHFHYAPISDVIKKEKNGKHKVVAWFGEIMASIAYSTSRGILLGKTSGTIFDGFILPVIDPRDLLAEQKDN